MFIPQPSQISKANDAAILTDVIGLIGPYNLNAEHFRVFQRLADFASEPSFSTKCLNGQGASGCFCPRMVPFHPVSMCNWHLSNVPKTSAFLQTITDGIIDGRDIPRNPRPPYQVTFPGPLSLMSQSYALSRVSSLACMTVSPPHSIKHIRNRN